MANEITARWHDSGSTLYAQVLNTTGAVYNGSTFETPADANWTDYDIALTEAGTTRFYRGTFPAVAAGLYTVLLYEQAGASPAVADTLIGLGEVQWDGSAVVATSSLATAAALATVDGNVDSILTDTGTTIPAQISALNNLSAAQVNAEVDTALADYDAPTKAELDAGLAALNDITAADVLAAINAATIDGTITRIQKERIELAVLAGKSTGGGTSTVTFRNQADDAARVTATVDNDGNRTAVTLDGS